MNHRDLAIDIARTRPLRHLQRESNETSCSCVN